MGNHSGHEHMLRWCISRVATLSAAASESPRTFYRGSVRTTTTFTDNRRPAVVSATVSLESVKFLRAAPSSQSRIRQPATAPREWSSPRFRPPPFSAQRRRRRRRDVPGILQLAVRGDHADVVRHRVQLPQGAVESGTSNVF